MNKIDWDTLYMTMVYLMAMKSKDKKTHIGAVVVGQFNEIISTGFNGMPIGVNDDVPERHERPEKYYWMEHAERNSILLSSNDVRGCKMYTNGIPCTGCARSIIQSGISEVIVDKVWDDNNHGQWIEKAERSKTMFEESGVKFRFWRGKLIKELYRFRDGQKL